MNKDPLRLRDATAFQHDLHGQVVRGGWGPLCLTSDLPHGPEVGVGALRRGRMTTRRTAGFSIVELLIALGVIAFLMVIVLVIQYCRGPQVEEPFDLVDEPAAELAAVRASQPPQVDAVEITPSTIFIPVTDETLEFAFRVRVRSSDGQLIPPIYTYPYVIGADPAAHVVGFGTADSRSIRLTLDGSGVDEITLTVAVSPAPAAELRIVPTETNGDRVLAKHVSENPASIALVDGPGAGCLQDAVGFVGVGSLEALATPCSNWTGGVVFSTDHATVRESKVEVSEGTSSGSDSGATSAVVDVRPVQTEAYLVPTVVWIAVNGVEHEDIRNSAIADMQLTNVILHMNQTGIQLYSDPSEPRDVLVDEIDDVGDHCPPDERLTLLESFAPDTFNVYYVLGNAGGAEGWLCAGGVSFVRWPTASATGLAHEVGHLFSLGHTTILADFPDHNLMKGKYALLIRDNRHHLSLGQTFRMVFHFASWLNGTVRLAPTRSCVPTASICPSLETDLK